MKMHTPHFTPFWIGLFFALTLGSISGYAQGDTRQVVLQDTVMAREYLEEAKGLIESAIYDKALQVLDSAKLLIERSVGENDLMFGKYLNFMGIISNGNYELDKAQEYYEKSLKIFILVLGDNHFDVANSYNGLGAVLIDKGDYDKAQECLEQSLDIKKEILDENHPSLVSTFNNLGNLFSYKSDYDKAQAFFEQSLKIAQEAFGDNHPKVAIIYNGLGNVFADKGGYKKAQECFEQSLKITRKAFGDNHFHVSVFYNNLGTVLMNKGDYDKAQAFFEQSLKITKEVFGDNHLYVGDPSGNLGHVFMLKAEYDKAQDYYEQTLKIRKAVLSENHPDIAKCYRSLGTIFLKKGNYNKAQLYLEKGLNVRKSLEGESHVDVSFMYNELGNMYLSKEDYDKAETYYKQSLNIKKSILGEKHTSVANSYRNLGLILSSKEDYEGSISYFNRALKSLNFKKDSSLNIVEDIPRLLSTRESLGNSYENWYHKSNKKEHLFKAKENYQQYTKIISYQKSNLMEGTKLILSRDALPIYGSAIQTNLLLYRIVNESEYLKDAFSYAEKNKSLSLFEAIHNANALKYGGIPDTLLEKEYDLGLDIAYYNRKYFEKINEGLLETDTTVLEFKSKLFDLKEEQEALRMQFETNYQKYYELKYDLEVASVEGIQGYLSDGKTALVEYFLGDTTLFTFGITKAGIVYDQQAIDSSFHQQLEMIRKASSRTDTEAPVTFQRYTQYSYELYKTLLEPILSQMPGVEKLIIIPDGKLGYLPFETLLTQNVSAAAENYRGLPYLLRDYDVRYEYSATLLLQAAGKKSGSTKRFAGYAPAYGGSDFMAQRGYYDSLKIVRSFPGLRDGPAPLAFNQPEVNDISGTIGGNAFTGELATESTFKREAGDYQILHLAMHALVNDTDPMYSHLIFAEDKDSTEDRYLHAYELYNMQLDADLAVLSACETGLGKLQRGEGIMSLSRAFKYAGCPSIVTSLWKANDLSTKEIMTAFYQNLKAGMSKSEALRKAKLDYLDNTETPGMTHPSNWATFVLIGNNEPVSLGNPWGKYALIGATILGLGFLGSRIRRKSA